MVRRQKFLYAGLCIALASCADSVADRSMTAPDAQMAIGREAAATEPLTVLGADERVAFQSENGFAHAATGGRANAHFELGAPFLGILREEYSFVALSAGNFPSAKGHLRGTITSGSGTTEVHVDVNCLAISANQAWASGIVTRFVRDGVPLPTGFDAVWRVEDNGEGAKSLPDMGSVLFRSVPQGCRFRPLLTMTPTARGNIQLSQR